MALVDVLRSRKLLAGMLAGAVVGVVVGLFLPIRAAAPPKSDEASWSLPDAQQTKRFRTDQFMMVRGAGFWGEIKGPGDRGSKPASWTLSGIVTRPQLRVAVSVPGKTQQTSWVAIGGELPDGSTLVAANRDTAWYEKDGCRRARKLYVKPTAEADACIGAAPATPKPASPAAPQARKPQ